MTAGQRLCASVMQIHQELVRYLIKISCADAAATVDPVAAMIAAAHTARTFLDARREMASRGLITEERFKHERQLLVDIIETEIEDQELLLDVDETATRH